MAFTYQYPRAATTADAIVFRRKANKPELLLIQRADDPFKNQWALPGGFLNMDETLEECVLRETEEETGLRGLKFEQLAAFSSLNRDPRHRTITIAFFAWAKENQQAKAGSDAKNLAWFSLDQLPVLAFDHDEIIKAAIKKLGLRF
jgi:8-oxo-dGTP diphosphatase